MCKVDRNVFTQLLANLSELFTQLTGAVVPPPEVEHHATTIETEVNRINHWLRDALQVLAEQQPSSPKSLDTLKEVVFGSKVVNVDGEVVLKGSERDDRWGPGGTEVVKKKRSRS